MSPTVAGVLTGGCEVPVPLPCARLVQLYSTGPVNRDYEDLRRFAEAVGKWVKRVIVTENKYPLVMVPGKGDMECEKADLLLGVLAAVYVSLEMKGGGEDSKQGGGVGMGWGKEVME